IGPCVRDATSRSAGVPALREARARLRGRSLMASNRGKATAPTAFVIFGITGDLSARKLLPALYDLYVSGHIHAKSVIVGFARSEMSVDELRDRLRAAARDEVDGFDAATFDQLTARLEYVR